MTHTPTEAARAAYLDHWSDDLDDNEYRVIGEAYHKAKLEEMLEEARADDTVKAAFDTMFSLDGRVMDHGTWAGVGYRCGWKDALSTLKQLTKLEE